MCAEEFDGQSPSQLTVAGKPKTILVWLEDAPDDIDLLFWVPVRVVFEYWSIPDDCSDNGFRRMGREYCNRRRSATHELGR
jgi:hypothetical protein